MSPRRSSASVISRCHLMLVGSRATSRREIAKASSSDAAVAAASPAADCASLTLTSVSTRSFCHSALLSSRASEVPHGRQGLLEVRQRAGHVAVGELDIADLFQRDDEIALAGRCCWDCRPSVCAPRPAPLHARAVPRRVPHLARQNRDALEQRRASSRRHSMLFRVDREQAANQRQSIPAMISSARLLSPVRV